MSNLSKRLGNCLFVSPLLLVILGTGLLGTVGAQDANNQPKAERDEIADAKARAAKAKAAIKQLKEQEARRKQAFEAEKKRIEVEREKLEAQKLQLEAEKQRIKKEKEQLQAAKLIAAKKLKEESVALQELQKRSNQKPLEEMTDEEINALAKERSNKILSELDEEHEKLRQARLKNGEKSQVQKPSQIRQNKEEPHNPPHIDKKHNRWLTIGTLLGGVFACFVFFLRSRKKKSASGRHKFA
jgi:hypothetical protein